MRDACDNVPHMPKMIQIRNVPESTHRALKSRAAQTGLSLSDFLLAEVQQLAELPSVEQLSERIRRRSAARPRLSSATVIRRHRSA